MIDYSMKHSDLPIKEKEKDELNILPFVEKFANGIKKYKQDECFVISVEGEWGIGKTSFLNLVEKELKNEENKFEILHFNPWLITDVEKIASLFLKDLFKVILHQSKKAKKEDMKKDFKKILSLVSPAEVNIGLLKWDSKFKEEEKTLYKLKEDINQYIKDIKPENKRKIVVIIDDIDRLADDEINLIFRLVKGVADFDNIIYILSFDRKIVGNSLCKFHSQNGDKYLDKIIQYPLRMPQPHSTTIKNLLTKKLDGLLQSLEEKKEHYAFNQEIWSYVYGNLDKYIKNIRDVNRLFDTFEFEYLSIYNDVNFVDFFVITLIRLFEYDLYVLIKDDPSLFIDQLSSKTEYMLYPPKEIENLEKILKSLTTSNSYIQEDKYSIISKNISLLNTIFNNVKEERNIHKQIKDKNYFSNYFSMSVSPDRLSYSEFCKYYDLLLDNIEEFEKKRKKEQKLEQFYSMYEAHSKKMEDDKRVKFIKNLMNFINEYIFYDFRNDENYWDKWQPRLYENLVIQEIYKLKNFQDGFFIFSDESLDIGCKSRILFDIVKDNRNTNEMQIVLDKYKNDYTKEISNMSVDRLLEFRNLCNLAYSAKWFNIDISSNTKIEFEKRLFENKESFFNILEKFINKIISMPRAKYPYIIDKTAVEEFIEIKKISDYIETLDGYNLSKNEQDIVNYWYNQTRFNGL